MKKTFRFLSMAALLVVGAIMTGCNSDDNIDNPQQPANNDNVVTLTATVSLDGGAATRVITPSTGAKTFEDGNQIAVFYEDEEGNLQKAESTDFTPLTEDATKAIFTVTLANPKSGGQVRYIYPASMAKALPATATAYTADNDVTIDYTGLLGSQNGDLGTLGTNYDLAVYDGSLSGTDLPASATLENPLAVCAFTLTDGTSPITSDVKSLTISDGTNTYAVTPSSQSPIYVAMKPATGIIAFTAATDSKTYFKTATGTSLAASTLYTSITVGMQELAVGKVFGNDGVIYDNAAAAGSKAVAMIAYLGSDNGEDSPYNHGLALAMSNAGNGGNFNICWSLSTTTDNTEHPNQSSSFTIESGLQYNDAKHDSNDFPAFKAAMANNGTAAPTGCSAWFLASGYQWTKMFAGAGSANALKSLAGLENTWYWTSSEINAQKAWQYSFNKGKWWETIKNDSQSRVRSCLAF